MAKTVRRKPGPVHAAIKRCVVCREIRTGPVAGPLPGRGARSRECICLVCAKRMAKWSQTWRKHIDAWEKDRSWLDESSAPIKVSA